MSDASLIARLRGCSAAALIGYAILGTGASLLHADYYSWLGGTEAFDLGTNWQNNTTNTSGVLPFNTTNYGVYGHQLTVDTTSYFSGIPVAFVTNPIHDHELWLFNGASLRIKDAATKLTFDQFDAFLSVENSASLTVDNKAKLSVVGGSSEIYIGRGYVADTAAGTLEIRTGGVIETNQISIGKFYNGVAGNGVATITDSGSRLDTGTLRIGDVSSGGVPGIYTPRTQGLLNISNLAVVTSDLTVVGGNADGEVIIDNATLDSNDLYVGSSSTSSGFATKFATGQLEVSGSAGSVRSNLLTIGTYATGVVNVEDFASLSTGALTIGAFDGLGILDVHSGGNLSIEGSFDNIAAAVRIGSYSREDNQLILRGTDTEMRITDQDGTTMHIGYNGDGTWAITDGAQFGSDAAITSSYRVGSYNGVGRLTISGANSSFTDVNGHVTLAMGTATTGYLDVLDGGSIQAERIDVGNQGSGHLNISGMDSQLIAQALNVHVDGSTVTVESGGEIDVDYLEIDNFSLFDSSPRVDVGAGGYINANSIVVGEGNSAEMNINNGGIVDVGSFWLGKEDRIGARNALAVTKLSNNSKLSVVSDLVIGKGRKFDSRLEINSGSIVEAHNYVIIGQGDQSNSLLAIKGEWNNASILDVDFNLYVGDEGNGDVMLTMGDHSEINIADDMHVGRDNTGKAEVVIDGFLADLNVASQLHVGYNSNGKFIINEGEADVHSLSVGTNMDSYGHVIVKGQDSKLNILTTASIGYNPANANDSGNGRVDLINNGTLAAGTQLIVGENGTLNIWGGELQTNEIIIENGADVHWDSGLIMFKQSTDLYYSSGLSKLLGSSNHLNAGQMLIVDGTLNLAQQLTLNGGTLIASDIDAFMGSQMLQLNSGMLGFIYGVDIGNRNNVLGDHLELKQGITIASAGQFTNNGWISGSGTINDQVPEHDDVYSYGDGTFYNGLNGTLHLDKNDRIFIDMFDATNEGKIEVFDGQLIIESALLNRGDLMQFGGLINIDEQLLNEGQITGLNTHLRTSNIVNQGDMDYADTQHLIFGDIKNELNGKITVTRGARLTLHDDVQNDSTIEIADDASVVIFGELSGTGSIIGGGTTYIEGTLTPGHSPGQLDITGDLVLTEDATAQMEIAGTLAGSQYDIVNINGDLTLNGILEVLLLDGFNPLLGQAFQLFDATNLHGQFEQLLLPILTSNLDWDTTQLNSQGVLRIIPEPTTALTLGALLCLFIKHRRSV
ncbi:hypothetical protein KS4_02710 [Poriferisphaera corsica]|uniref:PEP-CTERM protein-sorting domain-containing protein n=1 Tax=Poriferisphaera corsica TaxID=2528020 RepID=A0A517YPV0_9BACT|nr:hypothetical protein [Poriferisphaera corsica]QDU32240.1 hypothetical protein KS4_02710 [Poriferisphaera corsica]